MKLSRILSCSMLLLAAPASAQVLTPFINPTTYSFDHADFALASGYEIGYFADQTTPQPIQIAVIPKPATCTPCTGPVVLPATPIGFGNFYAAVQAVAGAVKSGWSNRVPFDLRLAVPTNFQVK